MQSSNTDLHKPTPALSAIETEIIELFVHLLHPVGLPKTAGEIYGLLFVSAAPLAFEDIMNKLNISSGSVSQGLRLLRSMGAARTAYVVGDRRDYYLAETELRKLTASFVRKNIEHHLVNGEERLSRLDALVSHTETIQANSREFLEERVETLRAWSQRARAVLPLVIQVLN